MGRRPIIREAILAILKKQGPIRFKEIKKMVAIELHRKLEEVGDENISYNLSKLVKEGEVEETDIDGKKAYCLSNSFYKTKNKILLKSIVDKADLEEFYPIFEDKNPPLTAYFQNLSTVTDPLRKKEVQHFCPELNNWSQPVDLISRRMLESYTDLRNDQRNGVARLLAYAYWFGVQELIKDYGFQPLDATLERSRKFALECIDNAKKRGDSSRIEAENKIIEILDITKKIIFVKNLKELLLFFKTNSNQIKKLQSEMLSLTGQYMAAGEQIYDRFLEFHSCTITGLKEANLLPEAFRIQDFPPKFRYLLNYSDVWDDLLPSIMSEYNSDEFLESVNDDLQKTLEKIKKYQKSLYVLLDLPFRSKMFIFYIWGYDEVFDVSNRDFLPVFNQWYQALKEGNLDHRSWIFGEKQVVSLINVYKEVKKGKEPQNGIIDIESWTILDLYNFHPRGKDTDFWKELLHEINKRMQVNSINLKLSRHIEAVLEGGY